MSRFDSALRYFRENESMMKVTVPANIERYRKGDLRLSFFDKEGNPLSGVTFHAVQVNHEFRFGANIFMLDEFDSEEKNRLYREEFAKSFNLATLPFYWNANEPEEGVYRFDKASPRLYRRPAIDLCLEYCKENGIEPKCHCLNYQNFNPEWAKDADVETMKKQLERRFRVIAERYADVIPSFEVTNETLNSAGNGESSFYFEDDCVEWSFRTADRYFPNSKLIINDYWVFGTDQWNCFFRWNRSPYFMQIERLFRNGITHLDTVGLQFHNFFPLEEEEPCSVYRYNPEHLYQVLDTYAKLGKPLQITEMTVPAYSDREEDEEVQAELIYNLYKVFFSHPAMNGIVYWNLPDGYAAFAPLGDMTKGENVYYGGLLRHDLSEKPAYRAIHDLLYKEFHTETDGQAVGNTARFRGFYGDYDVTFTVNGKSETRRIKLASKANNDLKIQL